MLRVTSTGPVLVLGLLALTACTGSSSTADPTVSPRPSSTCNDPTTVPANCVGALSSGVPSYPAAAAIPPIPEQPLPSDLPFTKLDGRSNATNAELKTATFSVTVPAGKMIGSQLDCLGPGTVTVDTVPSSSSFQKTSCNTDKTTPSEGIAVNADPVKTATTFTVTITASAGSRWAVTMFAASGQ